MTWRWDDKAIGTRHIICISEALSINNLPRRKFGLIRPERPIGWDGARRAVLQHFSGSQHKRDDVRIQLIDWSL
jgi:hypothetical protein